MAKNDLKLNIKSTFDSDGMKKLDSALKDTSKTVGSTAKVIGSVSSELKGISGEAGRAAGAISGLFSAFTQGGPVALIIAGITTAVGLLANAFKEAKAAAITAYEAMASGLSKTVGKISSGAKTLKENLVESLAAIKKDKDEADKSVDSTTRSKAAGIKSKYQNLRSQTDDKYETARLKADEEYELRELSVNAALDKQKNAIEAATKAVDEHVKTLDGLDKEAAEAKKTIKQYETNVLNQTKLGQTAAELKRLQNLESEAYAASLQKGAATVAYQKEIPLMGPGGVQAGTQTINVTYEDALKEASATLKKFKEQHADELKALESYEKDLEKVADIDKQRAEQSKKLEDAQKELAGVQEESALRQKELNVELAGAREKYDEVIKNIDDSEKKQQDLDKEKAEAERKAVEALYENLNRQAEQEEIREEIDKERKKYKAVVKEYADKLKDSQNKQKDVDKALNDLKIQADGTRRSLADMARAAAEGWQGNPDNNIGKFRGGRRGALDADKRRNQNRGKNIGQAQRDLKRQAGNLFDRRGNIKRSARIDDIAKFAETADYLGFEGVGKGTVNKLRAARDKLKDKLFNKDGSLKNPNDKNSHDMNQFRRLDNALKGKDAADKAKQLEKDKEKLEKKQAEDAEKRTKALETISENIDKLLKKVGI